MLTDDEILRRLRTIKATSHLDRCARLSPSLNQIASLSGLTRRHLYYLLDGTRKLGPTARSKLSRSFACAEKKRKKGIVSPLAEPDSGPNSIDFGPISAVFD
jgi:hypothetical protein